jgi:hypothetical protein
MPAGDGTGPVGMGPRTGWGMGYCGGYDAPGWANRSVGRGFYGPRGRGTRGYRRGGYGHGPGGSGRGWRHWYYATGLPRWARWGSPPAWAPSAGWDPPSREQEVDMLRDEAEWLKEQLDAINERMDQLSQE